MLYLKYICLLFAIVYTYSNIVKTFRGNAIGSSQLFIMGASIVGYILLEFELGF